MRYDSPVSLLEAVGTDLGATDWFEIDQDRIAAFGAATDDLQWIHLDPERARQGPFGGTIAHGYLTQSLLVPLTQRLLQVAGTDLVVNAGTDRVRFLTPVPSGARIRLRATIAAAERVSMGVRVKVAATVEILGVERPALVAETLTIYVPSAPTAGDS
ncbi:MaoC family dehydratase [Naasia aerilata]|uniref:MaoC family dehydratase n=1 Tax=Naasia aerilata TaxID=1162966 RepID=A0ABN6XME0_9MICO|nr:MaoC family dehydratase [Naasia aerilata]